MPLLRMDILLHSFFYFVILCVITLSDMINSEKKKGSICQYQSQRDWSYCRCFSVVQLRSILLNSKVLYKTKKYRKTSC